MITGPDLEYLSTWHMKYPAWDSTVDGWQKRHLEKFLGCRRFFWAAFTRSSLVFDESREVPHVLAQGQTEGRNTWGRRPAPWWQPGCHSDSSSLGRKRLWPRSCHATSCTPPSPTGEPYTYMCSGENYDKILSWDNIPGDKCEAIWMVECLGNVLAKGVACTSRRDSPTTPGTGEKWFLKALWRDCSHHRICKEYLSSGSDQSRSHIGPSWGTSCSRSRALEIWMTQRK